MTATTGANASDQGMEGDSWDVITQRQISTATFSLRTNPPQNLTVTLHGGKSSASALMPLFETVEKYYRNGCSLLLEQSYFAFQNNDDILTRLSASKYKLIAFSGCITSKTAQNAITASVCRDNKGPSADKAVKVHVAVPNPREHKLDALKGTKHELFFRSKLAVEATDRRKPRRLPMGCFGPRLTVVLKERQETIKSVAYLIEELAPVDKRYRHLYLQSWQGTDAALDQLVTALASSGVRTIYNRQSSSPCWMTTDADADGCESGGNLRMQISGPSLVDKRSRFKFEGWIEKYCCLACGKKSHSQRAGRCLKLTLPMSRKERIKWLESRIRPTNATARSPRVAEGLPRDN